jgi:hypothetical protein
MVDDLAVLKKLYDNLFSAVTYQPNSSQQAPFDKKNSMIQFASMQSVRPEDFRNAFSPLNPTKGDMRTAEAFSRLVDAVPTSSVLWADSGNTVSGQYKSIVNGAQTSSTIDPKQQAIYDKAYNYLNKTQILEDFEGNKTTQLIPSPIYSQFQTNMQTYIAALTSYRLTYMNYDLDDTKQQREWTAKEPLLKAQVTAAWNNLQQSGAPQVQQALAALTTTINSMVQNALDQARQTMASAGLASMTGAAGEPWFLAYATPSDWVEATAIKNMTDLTLDTSNLSTSSDSNFTSWNAGASASWGLWSGGGTASGSEGRTNSKSTSDKFHMNAKVGVVRIYRPWYNPAIFGMRNWTTPDLPDGVSDGKGNGFLPLVPTALIVARDFELSGNFSTEDKSHFEKSLKTEAKVGWGPFQVSGGYSNSQSRDTLDSSFNGTTLKVPGLQIIGFVNAITPVAPRS